MKSDQEATAGDSPFHAKHIETLEDLYPKCKAAFYDGQNLYWNGYSERDNPFNDLILRKNWRKGYLAAKKQAEENGLTKCTPSPPPTV